MQSGVLNIHKPAGMTSHDVVGRVRRLLKEKRVGHAGTLDPDATGVLVIAVGNATRLLPHLPTEPKVYQAEICFGIATTTEDASGETVETADASALTEAQLDAILPTFVGDISQTPPMYSAVHHEGKRLYDLARQGITVERAARIITIHALEKTSKTAFHAGNRATATLTVTCGGGTYIRTLCVDIGKALGLPAHMARLVRTAVGPYMLEEAVTLETLEAQGAAALIPVERALTLPQITLTDEEAADILHGRQIDTNDTNDTNHEMPDTTEIMLLYHGQLLALARVAAGKILPFKVFPQT
jgi:tRNA pseudouridine55 synthase